jgi:metal-responsive CopG/Arc/MetJ family transcriptional regulator
MISIPAELEQSFLQLAEKEHKPVTELIQMALTEFLEDYHDAHSAEVADKRETIALANHSANTIEDWLSDKEDEIENTNSKKWADFFAAPSVFADDFLARRDNEPPQEREFY